jgi:capsular polysaccharide transport system permease protein
MTPLQLMPSKERPTDIEPVDIGSGSSEPMRTKPAREKIRKFFENKSRITLLAALLCLLAAIYWGLVASDRFVSEAHVIIQQTEMPSGGGGMPMLLGLSGGTSRADQLLLRDHLMSVDMLLKLEAALSLREHYSDRDRDLLSRMWSKDISQEWFHRHYLARVGIEYDEYAGVLVIRAEAYSPEKAQAIVTMLVEEGERYMNLLAHQLAQEQVGFIEKQVSRMGERLMQARQAVLAFQNEQNMMSPQGTVENLFGIVNQLEGQLTSLKTQRDALLGSLSPQHSLVVEMDLQIAAIQKQIRQEQTRMTSSKRQTLNRMVEEFQRLQMAAEFAQDMYKTALASLEKGRVDAGRT